jgi:hypothetical protein
MTHWTFEDSLKYLLVGVVSISFLLIDGPALARRLNLGAADPAAAAEITPEEAAHREALDFEQQYPMIDVIGYGHGVGQGKNMTYLLFGVVEIEAVQSRENELTLALMQLAGRMAAKASESLVVVHFSLSQGVVTGEFNCPVGEYAVYDEMIQADCQASLYGPNERSPLPASMTAWEGVGK